MTKRKGNKTQKTRGKAGTGRTGKASVYAPVSSDLEERKVKLAGGVNRNMSITNIPSKRPAYPHLLEIGNSELMNSLNSGLTANWMATLANLLTKDDGLRLHEKLAAFNVGTTSETRERMTKRVGIERPLCGITRSRNQFYNKAAQDGLASKVTPQDGILAVEEWHKEFSREIGMFVKFMEFCISVSRIFIDQRRHGPYGESAKHRKANGNNRTPYEYLYNELYSLMPDPEDLNIPEHARANLTLEDLCRHSLDLIAPTASGMVSDTWVFQSHITIHAEGFNTGYNSLDFGLTADNDGKIRMVIQPPQTRVGHAIDSDMDASVIQWIGGKPMDIYDRDAFGIYSVNGLNIQQCGPGTVGHMIARGVPVEQTYAYVNESGDVVVPPQEYGDMARPTQVVNGEFRYRPLTANKSSWIISSEWASYGGSTAGRKQLRVVPRFEDFKAETARIESIREQLRVGTPTKDVVVDSTNHDVINADAIGFANVFRERPPGHPENPFPYYPIGDTVRMAEIDAAEQAEIVAYAEHFDQTNKLWVCDALEILQYARAVARALPPEYLAAGVPMVQSINLNTDLKVTEHFDMAYITDMINLNARYRPKFNPVKNIDANNGPFWKDGGDEHQSKFWLMSELDSGDYDYQKSQLAKVFSTTNMEHGMGQGVIRLSELFALMNPRWCDAMWNVESNSALSKHERYVVVPAGRTNPSDTYHSAAGKHSLRHLEMMIYRLFGTFRCATTAPLSDIDYSKIGSSSTSTMAVGVAIDSIPGDKLGLALGYSAGGQLYVNDVNGNPQGAVTIKDGGSVNVPLSFNSILDLNPQLLAQVDAGTLTLEEALDQANMNNKAVTAGGFKYFLPWNKDLRTDGLEFSLRVDTDDDGQTVEIVDGKVSVKSGTGTSIAVTAGHSSGSLMNGYIQQGDDAIKVVTTNLRARDDGTGKIIVGTDISSLYVQGGLSWSPAISAVLQKGVSSDNVDLIGLETVAKLDMTKANKTRILAFKKHFYDDGAWVGGWENASILPWNTITSKTDLNNAAPMGGGKMTLYKAVISDSSVTTLKPVASGAPTGLTDDPADAITATGLMYTPIQGTTTNNMDGHAIYFVHIEFDTTVSTEASYLAQSMVGTSTSHVGLPKEEAWPVAAGSNFQSQGSPTNIAAWVVSEAVNYDAITSVNNIGGVEFINGIAPIVTAVHGAGALAGTDSGGEGDIQTDGYMLPENENVYYEQRLHEIDAAVLSYSNGEYYPTALSTDPDRGMYPFHRDLTGFKRALIQELQEELVQLHRLSTSPFSVDKMTILRVVKDIYIQSDYTLGYNMTGQQLGELFTSITAEALLAAQDVLVRSGQIG